MIRRRLILILVFLPIILGLAYIGRWPFALALALVLSLAAVEYGKLYRLRGKRPALPLMVATAAGAAIARHLFGFQYTPALLSATLLLSMTWHVVDFERGALASGTDVAHTLAGGIYVGWLGSYLISIRQMEGGAWWLMLVLGSVWIADTFAFLVGRRLGRHPMSPRSSPKKSWEGYLAGVVFGTGGGVALAALLRHFSGPRVDLNPLPVLFLAAAVSILTPLGDLGISMIKRELNVKDTGGLLLDHGGFLDRMDSWFWAATIGYYIILILS